MDLYSNTGVYRTTPSHLQQLRRPCDHQHYGVLDYVQLLDA